MSPDATRRPPVAPPESPARDAAWPETPAVDAASSEARARDAAAEAVERGAAPARPVVRKARPDHGWDGVERMRYKADDAAPFRDVTRQVLFEDAAHGAEWRYFEVAPGGWSTLERHVHTHAVMILRGRGRCLVGDRVHDVAERDLVDVPPMTWHRFRAAPDAPLGFLCLVSRERDRPQLPTPAEVDALRALPGVADFLDEPGA